MFESNFVNAPIRYMRVFRYARFKINKRRKDNNMDMNSLLSLRKRIGLTQVEAAKLLHISRRSYQTYESLKSDTYGNYKFKYFVSVLQKETELDEEHGVLTLEQIKKITKPIFDEDKSRVVYLFGSYARNEANGKSDVDLLIDTDTTGIRFYGLVEKLRVALGKKVDLLDIRQFLKNKELLVNVLKDGIKIYG